MQIVCIWSSWRHCHPKTPSLLASFKSRLVLPSSTTLPRLVVLEKRLLNGYSSSSSSSGSGSGSGDSSSSSSSYWSQWFNVDRSCSFLLTTKWQKNKCTRENSLKVASTTLVALSGDHEFLAASYTCTIITINIQAPALSSKQGQTNGWRDGQTLDHNIDPVPHTMWAVPKDTMQIYLQNMVSLYSLLFGKLSGSVKISHESPTIAAKKQPNFSVTWSAFYVDHYQSGKK